ALAPRVTAALRALHLHERFHIGEWRAAFPGQLYVHGQHDWQIAFRNRHHAASGTVDHRDGSSPIALARNSPILDAIRDRGFTEAIRLGVRIHLSAGLLAREPGE